MLAIFLGPSHESVISRKLSSGLTSVWAQLIGEGDKRLPDWFFGEECRDLLKTAMASRSGQDLNGLLEHPEHARVVFKEGG